MSLRLPRLDGRSFLQSTFIQQFGVSRHSALPVMRQKASEVDLSAARRAASLLSGSALIGVAVALLVHANLGLPPYDVLSSGLVQMLGLSLGQAGWLVAAVLFAVATLLGRRPTAWGLAYVVANGLAVDAAGGLLTQPETMPGRLAFVVAGIVVMAGAVNLVMHSATTGGPFELIMLAGEDRGISRTATRYFLDIGVLMLGLALGGSFGLATLIYAATMGLVLQAISQAFVDHRLGRELRRADAHGRGIGVLTGG